MTLENSRIIGAFVVFKFPLFVSTLFLQVL